MDATQSAHVACPVCGLTYEFDEAFAGAVVRCTCGGTFLMPPARPTTDQPATARPVKLPHDRKVDRPLVAPCPRCLKLWPDGTSVCTMCGFDRRTGMSVHVKKERDASAFRAGGIEDEQDRQKRLQRDYLLPAILLSVSFVAMFVLAYFDPGAAGKTSRLISPPIVAVFSIAMFFGAYVLSGRFLSYGEAPLDSVLLKLGALALAAHIVRGGLLLTMNPTIPGAGGFVGMAGNAILLVMSLLICYIVAPYVVLVILCRYLLHELDAMESLMAAVVFTFTSFCAVMILKSMGLPG